MNVSCTADEYEGYQLIRERFMGGSPRFASDPVH